MGLHRTSPQFAGSLFAAALAVAAAAPAAAQTPGAQYVAMGSSFAAGPGIDPLAPDGPAGCRQSMQNYPHRLAAKRGLTLKDVSCSGSTTAHVLTDRQNGNPPQIEAVGPGTRLVTLTIGGNDVSYLGNLIGQSCRARGGACRVAADADVDTAFQGLPASMAQVVAEIRKRAPKAEIAFVDYLTVLPASGACPDIAPLTPAEAARDLAVATRLASITADAAKAAGARLVKASALSAGHDACSADPWVAGFVAAQPGAANPTTSYHPNAKAMAAVAEALDKALPPIPVG